MASNRTYPKPNPAAQPFDRLLPFAWAQKQYPITRIHVSIAHDLVEHKYWGVDGARVEDTGVAPVRVEVTIPIANTIFPAKNEKWTAGQLYPNALREFIVDFGKRKGNVLQHPEFGDMFCKPERLDFELTGEKRGGTEIRASFVETLDVVHDTSIVSNPAPQDRLAAAAANLDAMMTALEALAPTLPVFRDDLASLGRKISAIGDSVFVASYRVAGVVNQVLYQANRIEGSLLRAKNALTHPGITNCRIIQAAAYELRKRLLSPQGIGLYVVRVQTTLPALASTIPAKVGDLIKLNPQLLRSPIVTRGAAVRYLLAA